jgi:hypothetical protein
MLNDSAQFSLDGEAIYQMLDLCLLPKLQQEFDSSEDWRRRFDDLNK